METSEMCWKEIVKNADAYKQIGQTEIYLYRHNGVEPPWQITDTCEPGGMHCLGISTSVNFKGRHSSGLVFNWSIDIKKRDADGCGVYKIDRELIAEVLAKLPRWTAEQFKKYLADCAVAIQKKGDEYQNAANSQFADAQLLRILAK